MATLTAVGDDTLQTLSTDELHRRFSDLASVLLSRLGANSPVESMQAPAGLNGDFHPARMQDAEETDAEFIRKSRERLRLAPGRFIEVDELLRRLDD